ncbi:phosphatidylinositol-specific phospholipase C [Prescottella defluvii]|uniref:phosphatidylinositol-specific phospholipase C n=1 Tax=Prescottella defluvii TaxID=1323361 RepID=UPI0004F29219|nr:phosphatidylinositol-specific phospholipase C [Prescottella defluvii]
MADALRPGRRTVLRAFAASPLLLLVPTGTAAAQSTSSLGSADLAAGSFGRGDLDTASAPDWMRSLSDATSLAALSLPGTHDTMAHNSSIPTLTQDFDLDTQLRAGVRALDIRTRHFRDVFPIHHGPEYLHANFTDVVRTVTDFLRANPSETVLMRLKKEHTEEENTRTYQATLDWYIHENPDTSELLGRHLWTPPADYDGGIPGLSATRGKIVVLQDFTATSEYGPRWSGPATDIQDDFELSGLAAVPGKWDKARTHFERAAAGDDATLFVNHLSATGASPVVMATGTVPITVAKGAPGTVGMLARAEDYLRVTTGRTGVVMADFPSAGLVQAVIARNFS